MQSYNIVKLVNKINCCKNVVLSDDNDAQQKKGATIECRAKIKAICLAARLARQWMKERGIIDMLVKSWVHTFSGSFGSEVDERTRNDLYSN